MTNIGLIWPLQNFPNTWYQIWYFNVTEFYVLITYLEDKHDRNCFLLETPKNTACK